VRNLLNATGTPVDGGLNPRLFGGGPKIGTNFAVEEAFAERGDRVVAAGRACNWLS
jgi:hypothetical protein